MNESSRAPQEAKVISLVERRNNEVCKQLQGLAVEVKEVKTGVKKGYDDLKLLANLISLDDPSVSDKVVDLDVFKKNKILRDQNSGWVTNEKEIMNNLREFIYKIRDAMDFLYNTKFKSAMLVSHALSSVELEIDSSPSKIIGRLFNDDELSEKPAFITLKYFIPDFLDYLADIDFSVYNLIDKIKMNQPNPEQLTNDLFQLRNRLQRGVKYTEYFLENFYKNNPPRSR